MRSTNLPAEADLLKRVTVRLIDPHEREEFDRRLEADNYLGRCALHGPSLRYVAELDGQYVALIVSVTRSTTTAGCVDQGKLAAWTRVRVYPC